MFKIEPGTEVTLARHCFQSAVGALAGTRCKVVDITHPAPDARDQTIVLLVQTMHAGVTQPFAMRVPVTETCEGLINAYEGHLENMGKDVITHLQAIDSIQESHPEAAKAIMDFLVLKLSPGGREFATKRPDKQGPPAAPTPLKALTEKA